MNKYLFLLSVVLLASCSGNKPAEAKKAKPEVIYDGNLIRPIYLGSLFESPNTFGPVWDVEACRKMNLEKISMYVKGGYLPNHMAEKLTYTFNTQGNPREFAHYIYTASTEPFSSSNFVYENDKLSKVDINKYLDFSNLPPVMIDIDSTRTISITSRGNGESDSLIFYPSIENPRMIVEIVDAFINSIEIFVDKGTNTQEIKALAMQVDSNLVDFELTEKTVTYMENGLPVESYQFDKSWQKLEKSKSWDYNSKKQPTQYKEWLHGTLVKDIVINYKDNNLPAEIIVDRKKYIFYTAVK